MFRIVLLGSLLILNTSIFGQSDSTWLGKPTLDVEGFLDVFYVYDFNKPKGKERQPFLFNHNRHNEFNVNLGLVKLDVEHQKYRANFAIQAGTYANDNYVNEPGLLKSIFEASVGFALNKQNNLWVDAGVIPSIYGFKSAISTDNYTLTRSLSAESSPYFLSGAKITYNPSDKLEIAGLLINGWQRIQRLEGNSMLSYGTQLIYKPSKKSLINWSTFVGTDDPDSTRKMRYFNDFYGQFEVSERFSLITGLDIGIQQMEKGSTDYDVWFTPTIIAQYNMSALWNIGVRVEYYDDESGVIIPISTAAGFQTLGTSLNIDYVPVSNIMWRLEGRYLNSKDPVFETASSTTKTNFIIATSIAVKY